VSSAAVRVVVGGASGVEPVGADVEVMTTGVFMVIFGGTVEVGEMTGSN